MILTFSSRFIPALLVVVTQVALSEAQTISKPLQLDTSIIPPGYKKTELPPTKGGAPVQILVTLEVFSTPVIDEKTQEISLEVYFHLGWQDSRLKTPENRPGADYFSMGPDIYNLLWLPDVYFGIGNKFIFKPPITSYANFEEMRITRSSTLEYFARLPVSVTCRMDFSRFPGDMQACLFNFFGDAPETAVALNITNVTYHGQYWNQNFRLGFLNKIENNKMHLEGREFGVNFAIYFQRKLGHHVLQTYIPSTLIVLVTWLTMFIPVEAVGERLKVSTTTLLMLTTLFGAVRLASPPVSYVKGIDIWMAVCVFAVFLMMAENIVILNFTLGKMSPWLWARVRRLSVFGDEGNRPKPTEAKKGEEVELERLNYAAKVKSELEEKKRLLMILARNVDFVSKIALLALFSGFIFSYAIWQSTGGGIPKNLSRSVNSS